jgi:hypothetical protein
MVRASGIYTTPDNATQLLTLKTTSTPRPRHDSRFSRNERALYFLLKRKPPSRCFDIPMLSNYELLLTRTCSRFRRIPRRRDPRASERGRFDGVRTKTASPSSRAFIDVTYPKRTRSAFLVATR